jgi:hypothetical protein
MSITDDTKRAFKSGENDAKGYRKDDPTLKNLPEDTTEKLTSELKDAKRAAVIRSTGKTDYEAIDKKFTEIIKSYAYRAGVRKANRQKYMTTGLLLDTTKKVYKSS